MDNTRNYYELLHVQPDAPEEVIRSSYRTIMQKLRVHPDLGGDERHAALVNEAYAILVDSTARAAYDETRQGRHSGEPSLDLVSSQAAEPRMYHRSCAFCATKHQFLNKVPDNASCDSCDSPLTRARMLSVEGGCRRAVERISKQHLLKFYSDWPQSLPHSGRSEDMSLNGMKFQTAHGLEMDQIIKIDCDIFKAVGRVVRCQDDGLTGAVGVQFITLSFEQSRGSFIAVRA